MMLVVDQHLICLFCHTLKCLTIDPPILNNSRPWLGSSGQELIDASNTVEAADFKKPRRPGEIQLQLKTG